MRRAILWAALLGIMAPAVSALELTPSQSEGPFYPTKKPADAGPDLTQHGSGAPAKGDVLALQGKVVDASGSPIANTRVEIWQSDYQGIYMHPRDQRTANRDKAFQFYGETLTGTDGQFAFRTIMPAPYSGRPRHIHAKITPPGGATLTTQFYFKGDDADLERDSIVRRLGPALERVTLNPVPKAGSDGVLEATIAIVVQHG